MQPANDNMSAYAETKTDCADAQQTASNPEPTVEEIVELATDALHAKQYEWSVKWAWVKAETRLVRKSILVTALATLAAFALACCCWLLVNISLAAALHHVAVPLVAIALGLLFINGALCWLAWRTASKALTLVSLSRIVEVLTGSKQEAVSDD